MMRYSDSYIKYFNWSIKNDFGSNWIWFLEIVVGVGRQNLYLDQNHLQKLKSNLPRKQAVPNQNNGSIGKWHSKIR